MAKVLLSLSENVEITPEAIRRFVSELAECNDKVKEARDALKEAISENAEVKRIDENIAVLKEERKTVLETNPVLVGFRGELDDAAEDRRQLIRDAKSDGMPRKEIDTAIKMLKRDVDPQIAAEVFANISDLVE